MKKAVLTNGFEIPGGEMGMSKTLRCKVLLTSLLRASAPNSPQGCLPLSGSNPHNGYSHYFIVESLTNMKKAVLTNGFEIPGGEMGIRTPGTLLAHTRFPIVLLQPDSDISPTDLQCYLHVQDCIITKLILCHKRIIAIL